MGGSDREQVQGSSQKARVKGGAWGCSRLATLIAPIFHPSLYPSPRWPSAQEIKHTFPRTDSPFSHSMWTDSASGMSAGLIQAEVWERACVHLLPPGLSSSTRGTWQATFFPDSDILAMPAAQFPGKAIPEWQPASPQISERQTSWNQESQPA